MTVERRPPPVTLACALAGFVGFMVMLNLIEVLSDWGSIELQEAIESALENEVLAGQDLTVAGVLSVLRVALQVLLLASIALLVFAIFTVRGDRASRWGLTVLSGIGAIILALFGGLAGLLPAILLSSCVFVLWSPEARVWFAVRNGRTPSPQLVAKAEARMRRVSPEGERSDPSSPPPGPGSSPVAGGAPPHPASGQTAPGQPAQPRRLPGTALAGAITMLVCSLVVGVSTGTSALVVAILQADPTALDGFASQSPQLQDALDQIDAGGGVLTTTLALLVLMTVAAGLGTLLAGALLLNRQWAYVPALVLTWVSGIGAALAFPVGLLVTLPALVTLLLLRRPEVRAWARR